jgi:hypothetical protein
MTPVRNTVALALLATLLAAGCSGGSSGGGSPSAATSTAPATTSTAPVPVAKPGEYSYVNAGLNATVKFGTSGGGATLTLKNSTGRTLEKPGLYVEEAATGKQINGKVVSAAPVANGKTSTFRVTFPPNVRPDTIGLLILLIGPDNYGAFVPPASG